jgi:hypothetical protein
VTRFGEEWRDLWIEDSGASAAEIQRGVTAAIAYFARAGWDPATVWVLRECYDARAQELWFAAETAAFNAAFSDWQRWPEAASLVWEGRA